MMWLVRPALCRPLSVAVMALLMLSSAAETRRQVVLNSKHRAASLWRMGKHQNDPIRQEHQKTGMP